MAFRPQDKAKVLEDVRGIISQQLGTEVDKVRGSIGKKTCWAEVLTRSSTTVQVTPESKFVDLGADSLDTVSHSSRLDNMSHRIMAGSLSSLSIDTYAG